MTIFDTWGYLFLWLCLGAFVANGLFLYKILYWWNFNLWTIRFWKRLIFNIFFFVFQKKSTWRIITRVDPKVMSKYALRLTLSLYCIECYIKKILIKILIWSKILIKFRQTLNKILMFIAWYVSDITASWIYVFVKVSIYV